MTETDYTEVTSLLFAATTGRIEAVKRAFESGLPVDSNVSLIYILIYLACDYDRRTALHVSSIVIELFYNN